MNWYFRVNEYCKQLSLMYDVPLLKVCGIFSALSVSTTFNNCCVSTERFLLTGGDCKVSTYNGQKTKAQRIYGLANATWKQINLILGGLKTRSFFDNIYRPLRSTAVTIDRWMLRWAGIENESVTDKQYRQLADRIRQLASDNNMRPHELQAAMWVRLRGASY